MRIEIRDLCKRYGETVVLDRCSLQIASGRCVALIGRSGSGKSTLLHLLAGIETVDSGDILIDGESLTGLDEDARTRLRRQRIGLVFQNYNLVPSLDVLGNVALPLELIGLPAAESSLRARELLVGLGLSGLERRYPDQLSGGQQQRVAVARCLAHRPGLVLADEPTASLDAASAAQVLDLLTESCRQRGVTLVLATHAQDVLDRADHCYRLEAGRLVEAEP